MKRVCAFLKEEKLSDVIWSLHQIKGLTGITMSEVYGYGRDRAQGAARKTSFVSVECVKKIKLEIYCSENLYDDVVNTIQKAAHTGLAGDGKVYVSEVTTAVRISSNERGEIAV